MLGALLKRKGILKLMLTLAVLCGISPGNCLAMPVDSQITLQSTSTQSLYAEKIQSFLNQEIIQKKLSKMGLTPEATAEYISQLDSGQIQNLAARIETIESAGNSGITVLLVILLVAMCVLYFADYGFKLQPRRK
ncbi:MAG: PA2779 family protein [Candidatus Omnitrophota bacterium]